MTNGSLTLALYSLHNVTEFASARRETGAIMNAAENIDFDDVGQRTEGERARVDLECEIRVGKRAWRKARIADLTPGGFQVTILDMPPRGTPVFIRIPGLQMLHAEVCWTKVDTAGCKFGTGLSEYVYSHILRLARI